jgi:hypothetical protein
MTTIDDLQAAWNATSTAWSGTLTGLTNDAFEDLLASSRRFAGLCEQWEREHGTIWVVDQDTRTAPGPIRLTLRECESGVLSDGWIDSLVKHAEGYAVILEFISMEGQAALLAELTVAQADVNAGDERLARRDAVVRRALAGRVPVREITALTGLTRARIYQIRDGRR